MKQQYALSELLKINNFLKALKNRIIPVFNVKVSISFILK